VNEYIVGLLSAVAIAALAAWSGLDRGRSFYPTALIVIAFYYVLFAAMGASRGVLVAEVAVAVGFTVLAVFGFKRSMWLVAAAITGHGVFDLFFHNRFIHNPGMPVWWPGFCATVDIGLGVWMGFRLWRDPKLDQSSTA
jgi:hypothetical protein